MDGRQVPPARQGLPAAAFARATPPAPDRRLPKPSKAPRVGTDHRSIRPSSGVVCRDDEGLIASSHFVRRDETD